MSSSPPRLERKIIAGRDGRAAMARTNEWLSSGPIESATKTTWAPNARALKYASSPSRDVLTENPARESLRSSRRRTLSSPSTIRVLARRLAVECHRRHSPAMLAGRHSRAAEHPESVQPPRGPATRPDLRRLIGRGLLRPLSRIQSSHASGGALATVLKDQPVEDQPVKEKRQAELWPCARRSARRAIARGIPLNIRLWTGRSAYQ